MNRKQAICYLIIILAVTLLLLAVLAMLSVWLLLVAVLLLVLALGLLRQRRPELFDALKKRPSVSSIPVRPTPDKQRNRTETPPSMVLVRMDTGGVDQILVDKAIFTIGRNSGCDYIPQGGSRVSRRHATVFLDAATRQACIMDNGSKNGTFVNNLRLRPQESVPLEGGDVVQLGDLRLTVQFAHF